MLDNDIVTLTRSLNITLLMDNFVGMLHIDVNHSKINAPSLEGKCKSLPDFFPKIYSHQYTLW